LEYTEPKTKRNYLIKSKGANDTVSQIAEIQKVAGSFNGYGEIATYCLRTWAKKGDPRLAKFLKDNPKTFRPLKEVSSKKMSVDDYGPVIWSYFRLFFIHFDRDHMLDTVRYVTDFIDPNVNKNSGCIKCYEHWLEVMKMYPPSQPRNKVQFAEWILRVHNEVRESQGKKPFTMKSMITNYGAPLGSEAKLGKN